MAVYMPDVGLMQSSATAYNPMDAYSKGLQQMQQGDINQQTIQQNQINLQTLAQSNDLRNNLLDAQAKEALAKANNPMSGYKLTGLAGEAESDLVYKAMYKNDPAALQVLQDKQDAVKAQANARWWSGTPSDTRNDILGRARALGFDDLQSEKLFAAGKTLTDLQNMADQANQQTNAVVKGYQGGGNGTQGGGVPSPSQGAVQGLSTLSSPLTSNPQQGLQKGAVAQPPIMQGGGVQPSLIQSSVGGQSSIPLVRPPLTQNPVQSFNQAPPSVQNAPKGSWKNIEPDFPVTTKTIAATQQTAQSAAGLSYLNNYIAQNTKYGGIIAKGERPWYWDAAQSNDPATVRQAVKYYTAQALKPELALYRIRTMGGQASARAMVALEPAIMGNLKVDMANLPAPVQQRIQQGVSYELAMTAYNSEKQALSANPNIYIPQKPNTPEYQKPQYSQEDLEYTAKKNNISVAEVKRRLGVS